MIAKKPKTGGIRLQRLHDDITPVDMITESPQAQEGPDKVVDRPAIARANNLLFFLNQCTLTNIASQQTTIVRTHDRPFLSVC